MNKRVSRRITPHNRILLLAILAGSLLISRTSSFALEADIGRHPSPVTVKANKGMNPDASSAPRKKPARIEPDKPASTESSKGDGNSDEQTKESTNDEVDVKRLIELIPKESRQTLQTVAVFASVSLVPAALLLITAFVRINIVLLLLRQALGSPQIPGNQVLSALALMLTFLVMEPIGERIYRESVVPLAANRIGVEEAISKGIHPIKSFMAKQIIRTHHESYLLSLYKEAEPNRSENDEPKYGEDFPFRVLAPAFLLSEITTAILMGFFLYLPFLVIDLVVSSVLAAMGLFMLPPTSISMPVKLIVFVLADGWLLISKSLLSSFSVGGPPV